MSSLKGSITTSLDELFKGQIPKGFMDKGTMYRVVYNDGATDRCKDLIYREKEGMLLVFDNHLTGRVEYINENRIIRIETMVKKSKNGRKN